ncbi:MAG: hypothetical protein ACYTBJ_06700 [Planctomycetota bacterium]|jgi:hypothetical protein
MIRSASAKVFFSVTLFLFCFFDLAIGGNNSATRGDYAYDFVSWRIAVGGNAYDQNKKQVPAFWARNASLIAAGHGADYIYGNGWYFFDSLDYYCDVIYTRSIILCPYSDYHYWVACNDPTSTDTTGFNAFPYNYNLMIDSLSLDKNGQFMIMGDAYDSTKYPTRTTLCADAAGTDRYYDIAALADSQKYVNHFGTYNPTDDPHYPNVRCYICNYADTVNFPLWRALAERRIVENADIFLGVNRTTVVDGLGHDNAVKGSHAPASYTCSGSFIGLFVSYGGATGGDVWSTACGDIDWVGWPSPYTVGGDSYDTLYSRFCTSVNGINTYTASWGLVSVANGVNAVPGDVDDYANYSGVQGAGGNVIIFNELQGFEIFYETHSVLTSQTNKSVISRIDSLIWHGIPHIQEGRFFGGTYPADTGNAAMFHDFACFHQVMRDTALSYFCVDNMNNGGTVPGDTAYIANYSDFLSRDLGNQIGPRIFVDTGLTQDGDAVNLYIMEYANAFMLYFSQEAMADTINARSTNYYVYDLGEDVYEIGLTYPGHALDSTYRSDGKIRIGPGVGVMAWKTGGPPPSPGKRVIIFGEVGKNATLITLFAVIVFIDIAAFYFCRRRWLCL